MKLFVIAALVAVAAAGRLEHLERSYLPPDNNAIGSGRSSLGAHGGFGSPSAHGGFSSPSSHGGFGSPSSHVGFGSPSSHGGFGSPSSNGGFGSARSHGGFGSPNTQGSFGANSGAFGAGPLSRNAGAPFSSATFNQYLPPDHGPSASNSAPQFAGASQGFGGQNFRSQYSGHQGAPAQQYGAPQAGSSFRQFPQQSAATNRQYLAPQTSSFRNSPQQAFDEQTGYHY